MWIRARFRSPGADTIVATHGIFHFITVIKLFILDLYLSLSKLIRSIILSSERNFRINTAISRAWTPEKLSANADW